MMIGQEAVTEAIWRTEDRRTYSYWKSNHEFLVVHLVLQSLLSQFKLSLLLNTFCRYFRECRIYLKGCESRHTFPQKHNVKWGKWFQTMYFNKEGRHTYEKLKKESEDTANGKLRRVFLRAHLYHHLHYPTIQVVMQDPLKMI